MLIRYKKNFEKIAMGLLSFMPEGKEVKKLQETIHEYENNADWHLYLWREDDVLGAIGLRIDNDMEAVIQHISVNPSHRNAGIGQKMVNKIKQIYEEKYTICSNDLTRSFILKCDVSDEEEEPK